MPFLLDSAAFLKKLGFAPKASYDCFVLENVEKSYEIEMVLSRAEKQASSKIHDILQGVDIPKYIAMARTQSNKRHTKVTEHLRQISNSSNATFIEEADEISPEEEEEEEMVPFKFWPSSQRKRNPPPQAPQNQAPPRVQFMQRPPQRVQKPVEVIVPETPEKPQSQEESEEVIRLKEHIRRLELKNRELEALTARLRTERDDARAKEHKWFLKLGELQKKLKSIME